jgi:hypothetical protein
MAFERLLHQSKTISAIESAACVLTLATLKELIIDSKFETSDMSANLIGIAGGVGLYYIIPFD